MLEFRANGARFRACGCLCVGNFRFWGFRLRVSVGFQGLACLELNALGRGFQGRGLGIMFVLFF